MVVEKKLTPAQLAKAEEVKRKEAELAQKAIDKQLALRKENGVRMVVLRERVKMIDSMYKTIAKKKAHAEKDKSWQRYVDCENKPFGDQPAQLREYLAQWECDVEDRVKAYFDWQLNIDERTLLDQSPFRVDRTDQRLRTYQPDTAPTFCDKITDALKVLEEIDDWLLNNQKANKKRVTEIKMVRESFQQYIRKFLDHMTHIIAGNIEREMILLSPTDALYNFKSDVFSVGIFTNRDVPLRAQKSDSEKIKIDLDSVQMELHCPHSFNFDGSAMRVFWLSFDHYSDYSPSYRIETEDTSQIQRNLLQSSRQEWDRRENMELAALNRMRQARAEYEAEMMVATDPNLAKLIKLDEVNMGKKGKDKTKTEKNAKKKGKGKEKKMPEPPVVTDLTTVNMAEEFAAAEEAKHQKRMMKLHPDVGLLLKPTELNQRKFKVLGGTFAIHYLQRPKQFKQFVNHIFQRTYDLPDIIKYKQYYAPYKPYHFDSTSSWTDAQKDQILKQNQQSADELLEITVHLPANVCWWEEPQVVRWQIWEESPEFQELRDDLKYFNLHFAEIELEKSMRLFNSIIKRNSSHTDVDVIEDFNLAHRTEDIRLFYILTKYIIPKLSLNYRFECELREEEEKLEIELRRRERVKREHEEDQRIVNEAKQLRRKQREAQMDIQSSSKTSQTSRATATSLMSIKASDSDSELSLGRPQSLVEYVEKRSIVQGTAARELFPTHDTTKSIQLEPPVHRQTSESIMLSQLIDSIELYNRHELPMFKEKVKVEVLEPTDSIISGSPRRSVNSDSKRGHKRSMTTSTSYSADNILGGPPAATERKGLHLVEHSKGKWISEGIFVQNYDKEAKMITFKTTNIGIFGFAQNQYVHFPFQSWELLPTYEEALMSVRFKIAAHHIALDCLITPEGFKLTIVRPKPALCPVKAPVDFVSLKQLIQFLKDVNMNIFPNNDAYWYIDDEADSDDMNFSYKHEPMVNHSYQAMAQFCQTHQFKHSPWNRLAGRRQAIMLSRQIVEGRQPEALAETQITPSDAYFVRTEEKCTPLTVVELEVRKEPMVQEFNCDLFDLLNSQSIDKSKKRQANTNIELRWNVAELLRAVQPLSYS